MNSALQDIAVALGLLLLLGVGEEIGFRSGRRAASDTDARSGAQIGAIQAALLGLLGLLLAFSFGAAGSRFLDRQDLIVQEANAIGTAYLRADLLDEPSRSQLRDALKRYTAFRLEVSRRLDSGIQVTDLAENDRLHTVMWGAARDGVLARPAFAQVVLPPVNDVIDLHSTRLAAGRKKLPALVLGLLILSSALSVGVIGYGGGMAGRRRMMLSAPLIFVIGTALWITIDLDRPRAGLLRLSDEPLKSIRFD